MKNYNSFDIRIIYFDETDCIRTSDELGGNGGYDDNELPLLPFGQ